MKLTSFLGKTLKKSFSKREVLFEDKQTDCFRLFNSEADGIDGLTIDLYGQYLLVQYFRPNLLEDLNLFLEIIVNLSSFFSFKIKGVLLKNRSPLKGNLDFQTLRKSKLILGETPPQGYNVKQNGLKIEVDLIEGQNTGLFLDMREIRNELAKFYHSYPIKSLLNLFCYTGVFSVQALKNSVRQVLNVDLSKSVLNRAKKNYKINSLSVDDRDFIYGDALDWLKRFQKKEEKFSLAIIDPPTFARNRKKTFSVKKDYARSLLLLEKIVKPGFVLSSINSKTVSEQDYKNYHPYNWQLVFFKNESSDFRYLREPYLKVGLWEINN